MSKMIYVVGLPSSFTAREVYELFNDYGIVERVSLVTDRDTGRSRGLGFVEMASGAGDAIRALDHRRLGAARLRVTAALPGCRAGQERLPKRARQAALAAELARPVVAAPWPDIRSA